MGAVVVDRVKLLKPLLTGAVPKVDLVRGSIHLGVAGVERQRNGRVLDRRTDGAGRTGWGGVAIGVGNVGGVSRHMGNKHSSAALLSDRRGQGKKGRGGNATQSGSVAHAADVLLVHEEALDETRLAHRRVAHQNHLDAVPLRWVHVLLRHRAGQVRGHTTVRHRQM